MRLYLRNAQHIPPPFRCLPSPQRAKQISFPLSPSTSPFLVEFSHLLFLPFLLHLRFFLGIFQIWILSWNTKFSSICKPALKVRGIWNVQDFRHTLGQPSLVLRAGLHYLESYFTAAARSCSSRSGLQARKKIFKQEVFSAIYFSRNFFSSTCSQFPWKYCENIPVVGKFVTSILSLTVVSAKKQTKWKIICQWVLKSGWFLSYSVDFTLG